MDAELTGDTFVEHEAIEIRSAVELPARRERIRLTTEDGLQLIGELAVPLDAEPVATLVTLHPNPRQGGNMDSHVFRKMANRLPALAQLAVLRFNTRGTSSPLGTSEGSFGDTDQEGPDVRAAVEAVLTRGLPHPWLVGWSFGTELALKYGPDIPDVDGVILLSPPLYRVTAEELARWNGDPRPVTALVPEFDTFLPPDQARERFAAVPTIDVRAFAGCKHLWVGETQVRQVIDAVVGIVNPAALPLPTKWTDPSA